MVSWRFYEKGSNRSFPFYRATYGKYHKLSVYKINETKYSVVWSYGEVQDFKKYLEANDWDEAKATALSLVKDYLALQAVYWRDLKTGVNNWIDY